MSAITATGGAQATGSAMLADALSRDWYHTIELAPGQATRGLVDLRPHADSVLPRSLAGKRVLDVGTFDGFWAFEMERRGAAEVVATDLDDHRGMDWSSPFKGELARELEASGSVPGARFKLAHEILDSSVTRVPSVVYDLEPDRLGGPVDIAFVGALLLHLRDPVEALEAIRSTLVPGGQILLFEPYLRAPRLRGSSRPLAEVRGATFKRDWLLCNIPGLKALLGAAGYERITQISRGRKVPTAAGYAHWHVALNARARTDV